MFEFVPFFKYFEFFCLINKQPFDVIHLIDQHLDLSKSSADDLDPVKGQIIVSFMSRDGPSGSGNPLAIVGPGGDILGPNDEPETAAAAINQQSQSQSQQQVSKS